MNELTLPITRIRPASLGWRAVGVTEDGLVHVYDVAAWAVLGDEAMLPAIVNGCGLQIVLPSDGLVMVGRKRPVPWWFIRQVIQLRFKYWITKLKEVISP